MKTTKEQDLIDNYVEGYVSRDEFERGVKGMSEKRLETILYNKAITMWGRVAQVDMAIEEMAELTLALCKSKRETTSKNWLYNVYEEIADVLIMLDQLRIIYGDVHMVDIIRSRKLERLTKRLELKKEVEI